MVKLIELYHLKKSELVDLILTLRNDKSELEKKLKESLELIRGFNFKGRDEIYMLAKKRAYDWVYRKKFGLTLNKNNKWKESQKRKIIMLRDNKNKDFPRIGKLMGMSTKQARKLYGAAKSWKKLRMGREKR